MIRISGAMGSTAAVCIFSLLAGCGGQQPLAPLPELGLVPEFALTERSGDTVSLTQLRGSPWVANFVFTSCAGPCPRISSQMAQLQKAGSDLEGVRFVTFTVDPETDTPAVLREYANKFGASPERWLFLTGEKQELHSLMRDGFKLAVDDGQGETPEGPPAGIITHSTRFVLVDANARIRSYLDSSEPDFEEKALAGMKLLIDEARKS
jgi:cytochrome oxidase Cu insertion factor (SCO1/SenC/PrrC family)